MGRGKVEKRVIGILGTIIRGQSFIGFWGRMTGSDTICEQIANGKGDVDVYIDSYGGSVMGGNSIINALNSVIENGNKVTFYVSSLAASMGAVIPMCVTGAKVVCTKNTKFMFHAPYTLIEGSKEVLQDAEELLESMENDIKSALTSRGVQWSDEWFKAGRAKWISGEDALRMGVADEIGVIPENVIEGVFGKKKKANERESNSSFFDDKIDTENGKAAGYDEKQILGFRVAAKVGCEFWIEHEVKSRLGDDARVVVSDNGDISVFRANGEKLLLKCVTKEDTIVAIDWGELPKNEENDMKNKPKEPTVGTENPEKVVDQTTTADTPAPVVADESGEPSATAPSEVKTPVVADESGKPSATAPSEVKTPVVADDSKDQLPAGITFADLKDLTLDMIVFAKKRYGEVRNEMTEHILSCEGNMFTKEELDQFPIDVIEKISAVVDKTVSPSPSGDGKGNGGGAAKLPVAVVKNDGASEGGSLPPPKY